MKHFKLIIAIAVAAAAALGVRAGEVSREMAIAAANAWVSSNPAFGVSGAAVSATAEYEGNVLRWWNVAMAGGTVFVAPDTSIEPVLAAVPHRMDSLPASHPLRLILSSDISNRCAAIASAAQHTANRTFASGAAQPVASFSKTAVQAAVSAAESRWARYTTSTGGAVGPLRAFAGQPTTNIVVVSGFGDGADGFLRFWNQSAYSGLPGVRSDASFEPCFNLYTPDNSVCGCVATAGAALLQYFGCTGLVRNVTRKCTYNYKDISLTTMGGRKHYDWSILPQEIGGDEPKTMAELQAEAESEGGEGSEGGAAEKFEAVASLLGRAVYDVGVCVGMDYSLTGSGASTLDLATVFVNDFGFYKAKAVPIADTNDYEKIYSDLRNASPVALSIHGLSGGHAILGVGYGEDDAQTAYTRLFMGWSGKGDAWYNLPDIRPPGTTMAFSVVRGAVTAIALDPPEGVHRTLAETKAAAAESMKPILLISGKSEESATIGLLAYVQANYPGEFEIYLADFDIDPYADQNPSYGVFNPLVFDREAENRWAFYNGRLAYNTDTNEAVIAETLDLGLTNWDEAYSKYLVLLEASTNGITVLESGTYYLGDEFWGDSDDDRVYENQFTNGQTVVISAAQSPVTNLADGIVWSVTGWDVVSWNGETFSFDASGSGTEAEFTVASNTIYFLSWTWSAEAVRLTTWVAGNGGGTVSPGGESWHPYGSDAAVVAAPFAGTTMNWRFDSWSGDTNDCEMAGSAITVPMDMPRTIAAKFKKGGTDAGSTAKYTLTVASARADVAAPVSFGSRTLSYGANTIMNGSMAVSVPETWEDATGGVWRCTGWTGTGSVPAEGSSTTVGFDLAEDSSITWQWEVEDSPEPPTPPTRPNAPIGPVEGSVTNSALVIYPVEGGQLAVETRVSNAVAGYWYSIWSADAVGGPYSYVSGTYTGTAKQLVAEPVPEILTLKIQFDPGEAAKFYKVYVTEGDPEE